MQKKEGCVSVDIGDGNLISVCRKYQKKFWKGMEAGLSGRLKKKVNNTCAWFSTAINNVQNQNVDKRNCIFVK